MADVFRELFKGRFNSIWEEKNWKSRTYILPPVPRKKFMRRKINHSHLKAMWEGQCLWRRCGFQLRQANEESHGKRSCIYRRFCWGLQTGNTNQRKGLGDLNEKRWKTVRAGNVERRGARWHESEPWRLLSKSGQRSTYSAFLHLAGRQGVAE